MESGRVHNKSHIACFENFNILEVKQVDTSCPDYKLTMPKCIMTLLYPYQLPWQWHKQQSRTSTGHQTWLMITITGAGNTRLQLICHWFLLSQWSTDCEISLHYHCYWWRNPYRSLNRAQFGWLSQVLIRPSIFFLMLNSKCYSLMR